MPKSDDPMITNIATTSSSTNPALPSISATPFNAQIKEKQETLPQLVTKNVPYKDNSYRKKLLDDLVLDMVVIDMLPLSVVEGVGFRRLVNALDPKYQIVSGKHLTTNLLPNKYNEEKDSLLKRWDGAKSVAETTDQWTSRANEGYTHSDSSLY